MRDEKWEVRGEEWEVGSEMLVVEI